MCSVPAVFTPPLPTHGPLIAYDEFVEGPAPTGSYRGNRGLAIYLDQDGVAFFGLNHFVRIDLDGHFVSRSPIPLTTYGESSMWPVGVVQHPAGYAAVLGEPNAPQGWFCLIAHDTWPDVGSCAAVPHTTVVLAWDDTAFQLFSYGSVATYDATGTWVEDRAFPQSTAYEWPRAAWYLGNNVVFDWYGFDSTECYTELLWVMPPSLDADAGTKLEPDPTDFRADWVLGVRTDTFAAFLARGPCFRKPDYAPLECQAVAPVATFLTVIGSDGQPQLLRHPLPIPDADQLTWDGENLVAVRAQGDQGAIFVYVFDLLGSTLRVARLGEAEYGFGFWKYPAHALLVALAPNDYIIIYNTVQENTFATRFQLVPL